MILMQEQEMIRACVQLQITRAVPAD